MAARVVKDAGEEWAGGMAASGGGATCGGTLRGDVISFSPGWRGSMLQGVDSRRGV